MSTGSDCGGFMETIFRCCAGLDVHESSVEARVRRLKPDGTLEQQTRHWRTMTADLKLMVEWLAGWGVTHVAMESTGVLRRLERCL